MPDRRQQLEEIAQRLEPYQDIMLGTPPDDWIKDPAGIGTPTIKHIGPDILKPGYI